MAMTTPSRQRRWRCRAAAVLCLTLAAAQRPAEASDNNNPVDARFSVNAAVQPPTTTPSLDELLAMLNQSRMINGGAILNPFTRTRTPIFAAIPTPSTSASSSPPSFSPVSALETSSPEVEAEEPSTATAYDETHPATTETPAPASDADTTDAEFYPTEDAAPSEGSKDAPAAPSTPQENEELSSESPPPSASRSPNSISFDVVKPQSHSSNGDEVDAASTTAPPPPPTTTTTTETPAATATATPQTPSVTPAAPLPSTTTPTNTGNATGNVTTTQVPTNATTTITKLPAAQVATPTAHNQASGGVASTAPTVDKGVSLIAETSRPGNPSGGGHSSSTGEQAVSHRKKKKNTSGSAGSGGGGGTESLESSNQSGGSRYSMGTASIMSIVGVIVGICVIVSLFVLISRRKYDNDDDDDDDVLGYGGHGGYGHGNGIKLALGHGTNSIVRLSPTFLMNDMAAPVPGQPMEPDFGSYSPRHNNMMVMNSMPSTRGGLGAMPAETPPMTTPMMMMGSYGQQQPLYHHHHHHHHHHSISGGGEEQDGGPSPSAFDSTDDLSMLDSRSSDGWSSVLESESEFDHRAASRCTRDTTFSSINYTDSECNPADLRSGSGIIINRNTTAPRPPPSQHTFDLGIDEDEAALSYHSSHVCRSSDGSTGSGLGQSLRSTGSQ